VAERKHTGRVRRVTLEKHQAGEKTQSASLLLLSALRSSLVRLLSFAKQQTMKAKAGTRMRNKAKLHNIFFSFFLHHMMGKKGLYSPIFIGIPNSLERLQEKIY